MSLCTEAKKEGTFLFQKLITTVCSLTRIAKIFCKILRKADARIFLRLLAVNEFFSARFSLSCFFFVLRLNSPPLPLPLSILFLMVCPQRVFLILA